MQYIKAHNGTICINYVSTKINLLVHKSPKICLSSFDRRNEGNYKSIFSQEIVCRAGIAQSVEHLSFLMLLGSGMIDPQAPPMLVHKYVEWNNSAAMLAAKISADVTPEVN